MSIVESLACATPVVGSNLGGISELIDHERTGMLFDPGNHLDLADKIQKDSLRMSSESLFLKIKAIRSAQRSIAANANLRLTLETMLIKFTQY